ncbi:hypothetical protein JZ785_02550 [Alicyclobacillus curvatus]|nr:hypothetical protein JZ785_02550 [Alicyclobacillus curvatus]
MKFIEWIRDNEWNRMFFGYGCVPTSIAFAIQTKNGYVKAVDTGAYGKQGN